MWRLAISELANKSMYKDQELNFMNSIKAQVKSIYIDGQKVPSAFFGKHTKPIFRSDSARYVIFIQMSKEMWDFDTDGTSEIMFQRVINGFLPELFRRWEAKAARHLVSIILFTRMTYDQAVGPGYEPNDAFSHSNNRVRWKDFYRVLISDMASGHWAAILTELKREFRVFLRDVSIQPTLSKGGVLPDDSRVNDPPEPTHKIINGRPTVASRGNILEAINLAASQFSGDYIDRDLVRTGLSIIVITPGTGVFEVDYELFVLTTDTLIESGIGIDLVCLSKMPLHSVPLFKYKHPRSSRARDDQTGQVSTLLDTSDTLNRFTCLKEGSQPSSLSSFAHSPRQYPMVHGREPEGIWHYGIPLWADISFWTPELAEQQDRYHSNEMPGFVTRPGALGRKPFVPRVRMYELQMMGIMENEMSNISIPYLPTIPTLRSTNIGEFPTVSAQAFDVSSLALTKTRDALKLAPRSKGRDSENLLLYMDEHDHSLFRSPLQRGAIRNAAKMDTSSTPTPGHHESKEAKITAQDISPRIDFNRRLEGGRQISDSTPRKNQMSQGPAVITRTPSQSHGSRKPKATATTLSRQISFGLRGFGEAAPKAIPVIELSSENAQPTSLLSRGLRSQSSTVRSKPVAATSANELADSYLSPRLTTESARQSLPKSSMTVHDHESAQPINIKSMSRFAIVHDRPSSVLRLGQQPLNRLQYSIQEAADDAMTQRLPTLLSPPSKSAPWVKVLNPSNPGKLPADSPRQVGRWQHVFPRSISTSNIKWKSLCSPASVPLTTEDFPSANQLSTEYEMNVRQVASCENDELVEEASSSAWLMRELVNARLAHGFQIVVGHRVSETSASSNELGVFNDELVSKVDEKILMLRGSLIHQLHCVKESAVNITEYTRRNIVVEGQNDASILYQPAVRTALSQDYITRKFTITSHCEPLDWKRFDDFIARHEEQHIDQYPDYLHFWRARFVLIPVDQPSNSRRSLHALGEDNEEEIRLEGIRKLTQVWQRNRYVPQSEKRFHSSSMKPKDTNPLDILYQTRSPSAIVAAKLDSILISGVDDGEGKHSQLLPESELFDRANLNMKSLALAIQSDRGVKLEDRWWHLRLHYNCFIGMELTTWLLNNFKDVDSREEAIGLGTELFKSGLFQHVEQRHTFRDGNFFYQIAEDYRAPRAASRNGWFGGRRSDQSVPSTPMNESIKPLTTGVRSRSSSKGEEAPEGKATSPAGKRKISVALSKRLVYDVDHRKRSYRSELISLHYDRISSADDCYHLRIDWLNVTPKLIEDSIVNWATTAERFGLRLVELPVGEASRINELHPFRAPYLVRLARRPPERQPQCYFYATSFAPQAITGQMYQKAILKKFNFVLDLEAAKDFPPSVDVMYSWGKPDYRYPQYISREGVVLAQITDEGDFLLLANRLYNNRSAATKEVARNADHHDRTTGTQSSPARGAGKIHGSSPCPSPMIRATPDVEPGFARSDQITPEKIAHDIEAFCSDPQILDRFYEEVLNKNTPAGLNTLSVEGENNIPPSRTPSQLHLRRDSSPPNLGETSGTYKMSDDA